MSWLNSAALAWRYHHSARLFHLLKVAYAASSQSGVKGLLVTCSLAFVGAESDVCLESKIRKLCWRLSLALRSLWLWIVSATTFTLSWTCLRAVGLLWWHELARLWLQTESLEPFFEATVFDFWSFVHLLRIFSGIQALCFSFLLFWALKFHYLVWWLALELQLWMVKTGRCTHAFHWKH